MRLPEKIKAQRDALDQARDALGILMADHGDVVRLYTKLTDSEAVIEKRLIELCKEEADSDPEFRSLNGKSFGLSLTPNRYVDVKALKALLPNPLEQYPGLVEPKDPTIVIATLETLVKAKALPAEALTTIKIKSFTAKVEDKEESK